MALIPGSRYPAQTDAAAAYPQGKARNAGSFQDGSGTPLERDWINDIWGFEQALLAAGGIAPSGIPDAVGASQYLQALQNVTNAVVDAKVEGVALANWQSQTSGTGSALRGIAWGASLFVAVGLSAVIITSPDGTTWTPRAGGANPFLAITWSGSLFVAVGSLGTIRTSPDGITWTARTSGTSEVLSGVTWNGSLFVVGGGAGTILTSPDGITWTPRTSGTANEMRRGAWNGSLFVVVGAAGTILTSPDGITWTSRTSGTAQSLNGCTWDGSLFVAVGNAGTLLTSPDGITWTSRTHPKGSVDSFNAFSTGRNVVAMGSAWIIVSHDHGVTWRAAAPADMSAGAWDGQAAVLCGFGGAVIRSLRVLA